MAGLVAFHTLPFAAGGRIINPAPAASRLPMKFRRLFMVSSNPFGFRRELLEQFHEAMFRHSTRLNLWNFHLRKVRHFQCRAGALAGWTGAIHHANTVWSGDKYTGAFPSRGPAHGFQRLPVNRALEPQSTGGFLDAPEIRKTVGGPIRPCAAPRNVMRVPDAQN